MTDFYDDLFLISLTAFTSVSFACASLAMLKRTRERSVMLRILVAGLSMLTMGSGLAIVHMIGQRILSNAIYAVTLLLALLIMLSVAFAIHRFLRSNRSATGPPGSLWLAAIAAGGAAHLAYVAGLTARGESEWVAVLPAVTAGLFLITAFITWGGVNVIRPDPARSTGILDRETEPFRPRESGYDEGEKTAHPAAASMAEISASLSPPLPVSSASPESPRSTGTSPLISAPSVQAPSGSTSSVSVTESASPLPPLPPLPPPLPDTPPAESATRDATPSVSAPDIDSSESTTFINSIPIAPPMPLNPITTSSAPLRSDSAKSPTSASGTVDDRKLFKKAADPMLLIEYEGEQFRVTDVNPCLLELLHYPPQQLSSIEPERLFSPEFLQERFYAYAQSTKSHVVEETELISREGMFIPVEVSISRLFSGETQRFLIIARNITHRKKIEKELNDTKEELQSALKYQQGITLKFKKVGEKYIHTVCDGQLLYELGSSPHFIVGKELDEFIEAEYVEVQRQMYKRVWNGENVFFEGDWKGRTIRGQLRPIFKNGKVVEAIGSYVDISERKRAEEQFAEASEQFESFINNLSDAIILIDVDGNVIKVNPAFETLYGWTSEEVVGGPLPMIPEERRQEFEQLYRELDNGKVISGHTSVRRLKNGVEIHVCLTLSPLRDAHGHITAYAEISRDITDTKIAETALKESEMRYRNLVENAPDAIIIHDHRHILYMNPAGVKMLGSTIEDPRRSIIDFVHPQDAEMLREKMLQILYEQKRKDKFELRLRHDNHRSVDADAVVIPYVLNGVRAVQLILRDVTERKMMERKLRQNKESLAHAQRIAQIGNWEMLEGGNKVYLSEEIYRIFGIDRETFTHSLEDLLSYVHPEDFERVFRSISETENGHNSRLEHRILRNGSVRNVVHQIERLSVDGIQSKLIGTVQDITDRKVTEELLTRQEKMSIVGQLAAGVAHEIRNPLTSIKGFVQLTKEGLGKHYHYDLILSEIDRMESIISELLLLAKPEARRLTVVDIRNLLYKVTTLVKTQAILNNIAIADELPPQLPELECVEHRIKQLFINLFKNAIESMPNGGTIRITASVDEEAQELNVRIEDEGCGIPEDRMKKLGEPFYSTKEKGTGMGLMLSYKIVEEHQGRMRFESEVDVGTTVCVTLPLKQS